MCYLVHTLQMSSDFAEIGIQRFSNVVEYENVVKILVRTFFDQKNLCFLGAEPPKSDRKMKLSDFEEIWYLGVFEGANFKNCIHFYVESLFRGL